VRFELRFPRFCTKVGVKPVPVPPPTFPYVNEAKLYGEEEANDPRGNGVVDAGLEGMEKGFGDGPRRFGLAGFAFVLAGTEEGGTGKGEKEGSGKGKGDEPGGRGESMLGCVER